MRTKFLLCFLCLFAPIVFAQSEVNIQGIGLSKATKEAIDIWIAEIPQNKDLPSLSVLIKEGDAGYFKESEWRPWWDFHHNEDQPPPNWLEDKHGAQVVWSDENSVGCVVHVPRTEGYSFKYGNLPPDWVLNHELSHCLWGYREGSKWWSDSKDKSIYAKELAYLEEEEWADLWALLLSQKYNKITPEMSRKWLKNRTKEALVCKCVDHWTNIPLAAAIESPANKKTSIWKHSHLLLRQSALRKSDIMALKWYWSTQDPNYLTSAPSLWLNKKSHLLELDL